MTEKPALPLPLPGDVDLSDLPHMPMFDSRLFKSRAWLSARNWRGGGPGLGFAMMNLWIAAFRTVPAGSLEDDDDMLADGAKVSIEHWDVMKDKALRGWERHGGRLWHPVICELAWDLWIARLGARHIKAIDSWRAAAKRAADKGVEPPDPPGSLDDWMADKYPASFAYRAALAKAGSAPSVGNPTDKTESPSDFGPKGRKGKDIPPVIPHTGPADGPQKPGMGDAADRKLWFAKELARLQSEFRPMLNHMLANLQKPGVSGTFGLVQTFKGCWIQRGPGGRPEIVARSKRRADLISKNHGEWMSHYWPDLVVRHAKVDELRERPAA